MCVYKVTFSKLVLFLQLRAFNTSVYKAEIPCILLGEIRLRSKLEQVLNLVISDWYRSKAR